MWPTPRKCGAAVNMFCIPSYSTAYNGTCGLDGGTSVSPWTPFRDFPLTWKQVFLEDTSQTKRGFPNFAQTIGVTEDGLIVGEAVDYLNVGDFRDKADYVGLVGAPLTYIANVLAYHYPSKTLPFLEAFYFRATTGVIMGTKVIQNPLGPSFPPVLGPKQYCFVEMINENFPTIADAGIPIVRSPTAGALSDSTLMNGIEATAVAWYDWEYDPLTGVPVTAPFFSMSPASATRTEGEAVTFTVVAGGYPIPDLQWRKDGTEISGATSASYTIASTVLADAGLYDCVATNTVSSTVSAQATLVVNAIPPTPDPVTKRTNYKTPAVALFAT